MSEIPIPVNVINPPDFSGTPDVYLRLKEFDSFIYKHGYPCYYDTFIPCPCKEKGVNSPKLTCKNCYGSGWVLVERIQTVIMFQQMNRDTEYKDWSIETIGLVSITTLSNIKPNFMNRFVLFEEESIYSELIYPITFKDDRILAFCAYPPTKIQDLRMYQGDDKDLFKLDTSKVKIDGEGRLDLTELKDQLYQRESYIFSNGTALSIRYNYIPSYHIIDVPRHIITSPDQDTTTKAVNRNNFPYHAIGRMSHLVLDRGNLLNLAEGYIDNVKEANTIQDQMKGNDVSKEFCDTEKQDETQNKSFIIDINKI